MFPSVYLGCRVKWEGIASVIQRLVAGGWGSACFSVFSRPGCCWKGERLVRRTGGLPGEVGPWPGEGEERACGPDVGMSSLGHSGRPKRLTCRTGTAPGTWKGEGAQAGDTPGGTKSR